MSDPVNHIVQRLLNVIDDRGLSDRTIEHRADVGNGIIRTWRKGHRPRIDNVEAVAEALGFKIELREKGS